MHHPSFTQTDLVLKGLGYVPMQELCGMSLLVQIDQEIFLLAKKHTIPFM